MRGVEIAIQLGFNLVIESRPTTNQCVPCQMSATDLPYTMQLYLQNLQSRSAEHFAPDGNVNYDHKPANQIVPNYHRHADGPPFANAYLRTG